MVRNTVILLNYVNEAFGFTRRMYEMKNRAIGIIFFRADNDAVFKEILVVKYDTKEIEEDWYYVNLIVLFSS